LGVGDAASLITTDSTSPCRNRWRFAKAANIARQTVIASIKMVVVLGTRGGPDFSTVRSGKFTLQYPGEDRDGKRTDAL
jgi:hypothetical protein